MGPTGLLIGAVLVLLKGSTVPSPYPMADCQAAMVVPYFCSLASRVCAALHCAGVSFPLFAAFGTRKGFPVQVCAKIFAPDSYRGRRKRTHRKIQSPQSAQKPVAVAGNHPHSLECQARTSVRTGRSMPADYSLRTRTDQLCGSAGFTAASPARSGDIQRPCTGLYSRYRKSYKPEIVSWLWPVKFRSAEEPEPA